MLNESINEMSDKNSFFLFYRFDKTCIDEVCYIISTQ